MWSPCRRRIRFRAPLDSKVLRQQAGMDRRGGSSDRWLRSPMAIERQATGAIACRALRWIRRRFVHTATARQSSSVATRCSQMLLTLCVCDAAEPIVRLVRGHPLTLRDRCQRAPHQSLRASTGAGFSRSSSPPQLSTPSRRRPLSQSASPVVGSLPSSLLVPLNAACLSPPSRSGSHRCVCAGLSVDRPIVISTVLSRRSRLFKEAEC